MSLDWQKTFFFVTKTSSGYVFEFGEKKMCHHEQTKESSWTWSKRKWSILVIM
jgi:hypothetical protein